MFDIDSCIGFITNKVSKKLADKFNDRLVSSGSTRVQWLTMYYLVQMGEINQRELAEKLNIKASTVARLIDRMEKEDLIKRIKNSKDKRITNLVLTNKGKQRINELLPIGEEMSEKFSKGISEEEIKIFNKVLNKMLKNIS